MLLEAVNVNGGRLGHQNSSSRQDGGNPEQRDMKFRAIKIDFPKFNGDNPIGWVYKANHYFALYPMPDGQKIWMASLYMEGIALIWFQGAEETGLFVSWDAFVDALQLRFGNSSYDDPMEALKHLKQTSTVTVYKTQFEEISNRLKRLSEDYKLSLFSSGLRDEIRLLVRILHPQSLNSAFGLAKMQEEYIHSIHGNFRGGNYQNSYAPFSVEGNGFTNNFARKDNTLVEKNNSFKPFLPIQKVTPTEMKERREKWLCYFCGEKWNPSHKCERKKAKFFVMEGMELFRDDNKQDCSTHNFLDPMITGKVGLGINFAKQVEHNNKIVTIRGMNATKPELVEDIHICQLTTIERKGMLLPLVQLQQPASKEPIDSEVEEVLKKFVVVFEEPKGLPPKRSHDHKIYLKEGTMPISVRPYRYPFVQKAEIEKIVKELLEAGVIRCSQSPFSSPVILVRKAYGSWLMCIDYRALNRETIKVKFPIPVVDELLDELYGLQFLSLESNAAAQAFDALKKAISQPPVLALLDFTKPFLIECDTSGQGVGVVLIQNDRPLAFLSQILKGKALDLSAYEKEFLALVVVVKKWRPYLVGSQFVIRTDQQSLKFLLEQKIGTPSQQKWISKLIGYDFKIEYQKGKENVAANALFRRDDSRDKEVLLSAIIVLDPMWLQQLKDSYLHDEEISTICQKLQKGELMNQAFTLQNGFLLKKGLLQPLPIPMKSWSDISMDFIDALPNSKRFSVILVVVDRLTKYAHFLPLSHPYTAVSVAKLFISQVFKLHGMPATIVTDRDATFTSGFWKKLFRLQATKMTSFEALYGVPPPTLLQYAAGTTQNEAVDLELRSREEILSLLRKNLLAAQATMKQ
ncbi:uncharacterized protein LOC122274627 [Carya illinoinensis]|uniref:uncharacterized protein LOC122274627 n=1 Tax=Carya illinoinensis TaxID=32201 RepID=UPI001C71D0B3|nr:uncharacterized protein LOC122274627 [Carya illinoinensis]